MTTPRPAVGSLYLRPNGEAWRVRSYRFDYRASKQVGERQDRPDWSIANTDGSQSSGAGRDLPDDAELIWSPDE